MAWTHSGRGGVHDGAEADHGQPLALGAAVDELGAEVVAGLHGLLVDVGAAQAEDAEAVGAEDGDLLGPVGLVDGLQVILAGETRLRLEFALFDHPVGGALDVGGELALGSAGVLVDGGHELVVGAEGDLGDDGAVVLELLDVDAGEVGGAEDGELGGVPDLAGAAAALAQHALAAQDAAGERGLDPLPGGGLAVVDGGAVVGAGGLSGVGGVLGGVEAVGGEVEGGVVAAAALGVIGPVGHDLRAALLQVVHGALGQEGVVADKVLGLAAGGGVDVVLVARVGGDEGGEGHDVLGEGARLVGADDGDGAEGLHCGQGADDGVLGGHDLDGVRVGEGDDGLQSLGDHGHGADEGDVDGAQPVLPVPLGVEEGREERGEAHGADGDEEHLGHHVDLLQHVRLDGFRLVHEAVDGSHLGVVPGGDGDADASC